MFEFKKFVDTGSTFSPKMTIRKGGSLGINQAAARRFGVDGEGYYAVFYYDKASRAIGIKIARDKDAEGAVKIQWRPYKGDNKNVIIQASIKSLLDRYQIDYSESKSYVPFIDETSSLIVLDLTKPKAKRGAKPVQPSTPPALAPESPSVRPAQPVASAPSQVPSPAPQAPPVQPVQPADQASTLPPEDDSVPF